MNVEAELSSTPEEVDANIRQESSPGGTRQGVFARRHSPGGLRQGVFARVGLRQGVFARVGLRQEVFATKATRTQKQQNRPTDFASLQTAEGYPEVECLVQECGSHAFSSSHILTGQHIVCSSKGCFRLCVYLFVQN